MRDFKLGDRVSVTDEDLNGEVIGLTVNSLTICTDDGFDLEFLKSEVVKIEANIQVSMSKAISKQKTHEQEEELRKSRRPSPRKKSKEIPVVSFDLHAEKLTKNHKRMAPHELLELQLDTAKRHIEFAIRKKIPKIVLIHGVGAGVLKAELEYLYRRYTGINASPADFREFGQGATQIYITQKASLR